ncbi:hypothetical protein SLE2022_242560 [Rubroshorea leprosula]
MADLLHRLQVFSFNFNRTRYHFPYLTFSSSFIPFSTFELHSDSQNTEPSVSQINNRSDLDERHVLSELSDLFQFHRKTTEISNLYKEDSVTVKQIERRAVDAFLLPEEKLRGVFLQKLKGKTAIENALANVGVNLSLDVVANVVNRGNLGGEAMVMFFSWAIKQPGIPKGIDSYNLIVKALGRRKFFKFMVEILHEMVKEGLKPNLETLAIVMDSFVAARQIHRAKEMFENLEGIGLRRDAESLNVLLQCLCQRSHVGAADSLFHEMSGKMKLNCMTYNIMIGGWSKYGRASEMERILTSMVTNGFDPDCLTHSYLIEGLGRAGKIDDAVEIFDHMKEKGCAPDTRVYNAMISNFISLRNFDECMKYYKGLLSDSCEPDLDTYAKLITSFLKARKVADALEMFDEMLDRGIVPTTGTVTSFIEPLCSFGPPHASMIIYKKVRKIGGIISLQAYKLLLMRLSRFGKCGMLLNVWDDMQESGHASDMEVYEYVINGLCNIGHLENAVLVMEEALRKGFCPSRMICSKLNNKLLASNQVEKAYKLFLKIKDARRHENARRYWRANGWHF